MWPNRLRSRRNADAGLASNAVLWQITNRKPCGRMSHPSLPGPHRTGKRKRGHSSIDIAMSIELGSCFPACVLFSALFSLERADEMPFQSEEDVISIQAS